MRINRTQLIFLLPSAMLCTAANAQWSGTYAIGAFANAVAIATDSTIYAVGGNLNAVAPVLIHVDSEGDTIETRTFEWAWRAGRSGGLHAVTDGSWLMAGSSADSIAKAAVFKFNPLLDSIQMVLLDTSEFWHLTSLDVASDSSILVFGETQAPADIGMMRLSPQLQVLDSVRYVTAPSETCSNGIATLDNGFAIASIRVLSATDYDVHVVKADATGNIQWQRSIGDDWYELGGFIAQSSDSNYYVACGYRWPNVLYSRSTLVQLNSVGIPQWYCVVPTIGSSWLLTKPVITGNGRILAAGKSILNGYYRGHLMCADTAGTLLWERVYATDTMDHNAILDMQQHSAGGFVLVGQAVDTQTSVDRPWVVRTDSMGCLVPGCDLINGITEQRTDLANALAVSPNPTRDIVQVSIHLPDGLVQHDELLLTLMDVHGRPVQEERVRGSSTIQALSLSLSPLSPGIYFLHLTSGASWFAGTRIVKQ